VFLARVGLNIASSVILPLLSALNANPTTTSSPLRVFAMPAALLDTMLINQSAFASSATLNVSHVKTVNLVLLASQGLQLMDFA
jgi:hypothetical protein